MLRALVLRNTLLARQSFLRSDAERCIRRRKHIDQPDQKDRQQNHSCTTKTLTSPNVYDKIWRIDSISLVINAHEFAHYLRTAVPL